MIGKETPVNRVKEIVSWSQFGIGGKVVELYM